MIPIIIQHAMADKDKDKDGLITFKEYLQGQIGTIGHTLGPSTSVSYMRNSFFFISLQLTSERQLASYTRTIKNKIGSSFYVF